MCVRVELFFVVFFYSFSLNYIFGFLSFHEFFLYFNCTTYIWNYVFSVLLWEWSCIFVVYLYFHCTTYGDFLYSALLVQGWINCKNVFSHAPGGGGGADKKVVNCPTHSADLYCSLWSLYLPALYFITNPQWKYERNTAGQLANKKAPCIFGFLFFISVNSIRGEELSCVSAVGVYQSHRRACTTHPLSEFAPKILLNKTKILPNTNPLSETCS